MHLVYLPAFLNIKALPKSYKKLITDKFESFYDWLKTNFRSDKDFTTHPYGVKKLKGIIKFMNSENWEQRTEQLFEYLSHMDKIRKTDIARAY
jgi:hypothetical protein